MDQLTKDIIQKNIENRVKKDFDSMRDSMKNSLKPYFNYDRDIYSNSFYLQNGIEAKVTEFIESIESEFIKQNTKKRESELNSILTNLGSYLEMINH